MYIRRGEDILPARTHRMIEVRHGEILGKVSGGGGGVGPPAEREPQAVLRDVINEVVTIPHARDVYRVAIDPGTLTIDQAATRELRAGPGSASPG
jgi:N-methylhydantoinase B/oxoprolinase/acetone carboxylase alpha subunit